MNTEPGSYVAAMARFSRGLRRSVVMACHVLGLIPMANRLGSYEGMLAIARISPLRGSIAIAAGIVRRLLDIQVNGQDDGATRDRRQARQHPEGPPQRVHFHAQPAVDTAQHSLIGSLRAGLADKVARFVPFDLAGGKLVGVDLS